MMTPRTVTNVRVEGELKPEAMGGDRYLYLPFDVPRGARRVDVSYQHERASGAPQNPDSVIDIGVFDSRGHAFLDGPGFRGWSGSARRQFFIERSNATPGYVPGPLDAGQWHVVLGLARIEQHLRYAVNIDMEVGSDAEPDPAAPQEPNTSLIDLSADAGGGPGRWMRGDLHCHTLHSDGRNTVEQIVLSAIERGLEFLAVTDHNTVTHHAELERLSHLPIVLIPGEEVTTYYGHTNAWGLAGRWVDFRCVDGAGIRAIAEFVLSHGGLCSVNHPKGPGSNWRFETAAGYPCMEVWQAPWQHRNWESVARWEHEVAAGQRIVMVGGSDVHSIPPAPPLHPHGLGNPTTWVYVRGAPSPSSVLEGIRQGHAFISADPSGPRIELTAHADGNPQTGMAGDALHLEDDRPIRVRARVSGGSGMYLCFIADGDDFSRLYLSRDDETEEMWLHPGGRRYVRAEVRDHGAGESATVWAMSNPIWFERG